MKHPRLGKAHAFIRSEPGPHYRARQQGTKNRHFPWSLSPRLTGKSLGENYHIGIMVKTPKPTHKLIKSEPGPHYRALQHGTKNRHFAWSLSPRLAGVYGKTSE
jgi:hypothetical protein